MGVKDSWPRFFRHYENTPGNVGIIILFRLGVTNAELLEKEFYSDFTIHDLVNLPNYQIYLKLMVDRMVTRPFSGKTMQL